MSSLTDTLYTLSSSCQCRQCDSCSLGTEDFLCSECGAETRELGDCDSFCYDYRLEWVESDLQDFCTANACDYIKLEGSGMGWQSRSGYKVIEATRKELLDSLTFSGEWFLEFKREGGSFTVKRSSHDEPTGAYFTIKPATEKEFNA